MATIPVDEDVLVQLMAPDDAGALVDAYRICPLSQALDAVVELAVAKPGWACVQLIPMRALADYVQVELRAAARLMAMRVFALIRDVDVSGVSGTGVVAEGVQFSDGTCVLRWTASTARPRSTPTWTRWWPCTGTTGPPGWRWRPGSSWLMDRRTWELLAFSAACGVVAALIVTALMVMAWAPHP